MSETPDAAFERHVAHYSRRVAAAAEQAMRNARLLDADPDAACMAALTPTLRRLADEAEGRLAIILQLRELLNPDA